MPASKNEGSGGQVVSGVLTKAGSEWFWGSEDPPYSPFLCPRTHAWNVWKLTESSHWLLDLWSNNQEDRKEQVEIPERSPPPQ